MPRALYITLISILLVFSVTVPAFVAGTESYALSTNHDVDIPDRTEQFQGNSFSINSAARANLAETVSVTATAPEGKSIDLFVYNGDGEIVAFGFSGTGTTTFDITLNGNDFTPSPTAGTYALVLQQSGTIVSVKPLIIRGYSVSNIDSPQKITTGDNITVTANIDKIHNKNKSSVEMVVANNGTSTPVASASENSDDEYEATISTESLSNGSYDIYIAVRGSEKVLGENELLGISDPVAIELTSEEQQNTPSPPDTPPESPTTPGPSPPDTNDSTPTPSPPSNINESTQLADPDGTATFENPGINSVSNISFSNVTGTVSVANVATPPDNTPSTNLTDGISNITYVELNASVSNDVSEAAVNISLANNTFNDPSDVTVYRYNENTDEYSRLNTSSKSSDDTVYIEFTTPGFSTFAIGETSNINRTGPAIVGDNPATDPDDDQQFEDINGDGKANFDDVVTFAFEITTNAVQENADLFDFDDDNDVNFDDVIELAFTLPT
mgnify:FL=1